MFQFDRFGCFSSCSSGFSPLLFFSLLSVLFRGYVFAFASSFSVREISVCPVLLSVCCFRREVSGFQSLIFRFLRSSFRQDLLGLETFWSAVPEGNCLLENQYCEEFLLSLGGSYFDHSIILSVCPLKSAFFSFPCRCMLFRTESTRGLNRIQSRGIAVTLKQQSQFPLHGDRLLFLLFVIGKWRRATSEGVCQVLDLSRTGGWSSDWVPGAGHQSLS